MHEWQCKLYCKLRAVYFLFYNFFALLFLSFLLFNILFLSLTTLKRIAFYHIIYIIHILIKLFLRIKMWKWLQGGVHKHRGNRH